MLRPSPKQARACTNALLLHSVASGMIRRSPLFVHCNFQCSGQWLLAWHFHTSNFRCSLGKTARDKTIFVAHKWIQSTLILEICLINCIAISMWAPERVHDIPQAHHCCLPGWNSWCSLFMPRA